MKLHRFLLLAGAAAALLIHPAQAEDQANSPEARLRDALKNTMLQLRTANTQNDALQAQVTDLQAQVADLTAKLATLTKAAAKAQDDSKKEITVLKGQLGEQETSIAALQKSLEQWKDSQRKAVEIANATEAKRAKLADLAIKLQRVVDDQRRKNAEMYRLSMELLDRYEHYGLGQAISAKEPFVGITRGKFESMVQDTEDKLTDQRITDMKPASSTSSRPGTHKPAGDSNQ